MKNLILKINTKIGGEPARIFFPLFFGIVAAVGLVLDFYGTLITLAMIGISALGFYFLLTSVIKIWESIIRWAKK